jgi:hypothetical protein
MNCNVNHVKLACGMFEEFEKWIDKAKETERWERVKLCAEGMMTVFSPSLDLSWLEDLCPDISKALSLLRALEVNVASLGGPSAILLRERWWLDYWETYTEEDWERLLESFQVLVHEENET